MDQISKVRFKNLVDRMLAFCEEAKGEEEKAILLRIGVLTLNKLRIHANADSMLGQDVRDLNKQIANCESRKQLVELVWPEMVELLEVYREEFA
jgi:hypothetical protein